MHRDCSPPSSLPLHSPHTPSSSVTPTPTPPPLAPGSYGTMTGMDVSTHTSTGGYGNGGQNFWGGHDFHVPSPQRAGSYGLATGPKMTAGSGTAMSGSMGSFSSPSSMHGMSPMGMMPTGYPSPNPSPAGCYGVATAGGYAAAAAAAANAAPYYSNVGMDYHHHHHSTHSMASHHHSMGSYGQVKAAEDCLLFAFNNTALCWLQMGSYPGSAQSAYASASAAAQAAVQANHHHGVIGNGRPTVPSGGSQQQQQQQDCLDYEAKFQVLWLWKETGTTTM